MTRRPPAAAQMSWLLDLLAGGAMNLGAREVEEHAAATLLAQTPAEALAGRLQDLATIMGGLTVERVDDVGPYVQSVRVLAYGYGWEVEIAVETEAPHRIARLDFRRWFAPPTGFASRPWAEISSDISAVEGGSGALPPKLAEELRLMLEEATERLRLVGLAAGVVKGQELVYSSASGPARLEPREPVTDETLFMICSISKTLTALGVLQLWERGLYSLDDPVNEHLRAFRVAHHDPDSPAVTIRHLLSHTSGAYAPVSLGWEEGEPLRSLADVYGGLLACQFPPGSRWSYSDHGFAALGQLIADVSGRSFVEYMRENLFDPLGMDRSDFAERADDQLAVGYGGAEGRLWEELRLGPGPFLAAGSVTSNVLDMARFLRALVCGGANDHGRVISHDTLRQALAPQAQLPIPGFSAGLGFVVTELEGRPVAWHNGGWPGFSSTMWFAPDDGWGLVVLTNTGDVTGRGNDLDTVGMGLLARLLAYEAEP